MKASNNQTFNNDSPDEESHKAIKPLPVPINDKPVSEKPEIQDKNMFSPVPSQDPDAVLIPHFKMQSGKKKKDETKEQREERKAKEKDKEKKRSKSRKKDKKDDKKHKSAKKETAEEGPKEENRLTLNPEAAKQ